MKKLGGDPEKINPLVPVDLVIDHSVQVDQFGTSAAFAFNTDVEYQRNRERYVFPALGPENLSAISVWSPRHRYLPPGELGVSGQRGPHPPSEWNVTAFPDTLVEPIHTVMINGLGVVGWGVGGIEAEAAMLGQPVPCSSPSRRL